MSDGFTALEERFIEASGEVFRLGREIEAAERRVARIQQELGLVGAMTTDARDTAFARMELLLREAADRFDVDQSIVDDAVAEAQRVFAMYDALREAGLFAATDGQPSV